MALAIIDFTGTEGQYVVFTIDIGTNSFYKLKIGSAKDDIAGIEMVTNSSTATRLKRKQNSGTDFFESSEQIRLPKNLFDRTNCYVQLISCKDESGRSPAISKVIRVPVEYRNVRSDLLDLNSSISGMAQQIFNANRRLSQSNSFLTHAMSFEDILSSLLRNVLPAAISLLGNSPGNNSAATSGAARNASPNQADTANAIGGLLSLLLRSAAPQSAAVSAQQSVGNGDLHLNRFTNNNDQFSKPFIFGIDDALLATLAGPLIQQGIQILPQLINAANQHKLDVLRANNQLMTGLNADVQRRLMLQQLLQNFPTSAAGGSSMDPAQLMQLLQQLQPAAASPAPATPAAPTPAPAAPAPARATSMSYAYNAITYSLSNSVMLSFENLNKLKWNGFDRLVYQKNKPVKIDIKLTVNPAPKTQLSKAIFKFSFKDADQQKVVFEKIFRQKNIAANSIVSFTIPAEELASVPVQKKLSLFAEMRWLSASSGKEYKALGSEDAVFVNDYFIKETGAAQNEEKELADLNTYRTFWNKIWESQTLNQGGDKTLWEINANLRYSVFLSPDHDANGLIETKIQQSPDDTDSLTLKTFGKIKSGIELSISELNKLCSLWQGENPVDNIKLQAISNAEFSKNNASEFITNIRMRGRAGERGLVWVIPTFKLLEITLYKVNQTNESGQVTGGSEEKVKFPVPVSCRILGLKNKK